MHFDARRRRFIATALGVGAAPLLAGAMPAFGRAPAFLRTAGPRRGDKLRLACIGTANRAWDDIQEVKHEQIVALCDVDSNYLARAGGEFPDAKRFRDFRQLIAQAGELKLDGVVVATPDHTHALASALALRAKLPVYTEKPLTHTVQQARTLERLAREAGVATQMGTQIHAEPNYRRVVEAIRAGAVGRVTAVDCWQLKSWGDGRLTPGAECPPQLDWDLWLGPAAAAPFVRDIHPANWRRYWDYGTGTLGDMGCHILDLPMWALDLAGAPGSTMQVHTEGPPPDAVGAPPWLEVSWSFPQGEGRDPLIIRWFDGGRKPPFVQEIGAKDKQDYHGRFSVCFQGTEGALFANYGEMLLWPPARAEQWKAPAQSIPASAGHHREWLQAIREGKPAAPLCNFAYASRLTQMVLMGTVAYRAQKPLRYDAVQGRVGEGTAPEQGLLHEPERAGWALPV